MSYHLFLDDVRMPGDASWVRLPSARYDIVRSYDEFVEFIQERGVPEFVSFDHDLADEHYVAMLLESQGKHADYGPEKSGYDCAKWLVNFCDDQGVKFPGYAVHSMNPTGAENIINYIENAKKHLGL